LANYKSPDGHEIPQGPGNTFAFAALKLLVDTSLALA
jgi:hypothetical protein